MRFLLFIILTTLTLSSCTRLTAQKESETGSKLPLNKISWQMRKANLDHIKTFKLSGKIAVSSKREAGSASVTWKEYSNQYLITLEGPFGANNMALTGNASDVTLQMEGKTYHAASAEELLDKKWGYQLPISNMKYWIRGLPVPGVPANLRFDERNRIATLTQQGFHITYSDYQQFNQVDLPVRMTLYSNALRIKIIIYHWQIA